MEKNLNIKGFTQYSINEKGEVFSYKGHKKLVNETTPKGYKRIDLYCPESKKRRKFYIHKLLFATFHNLDYDSITCYFYDNNKENISLLNIGIK